jgi:hypothetical protein
MGQVTASINKLAAVATISMRVLKPADAWRLGQAELIAELPVGRECGGRAPGKALINAISRRSALRPLTELDQD